MKKTKKRVLVAGLATSLILSMCSSAMAATVYVGNVGFNLDTALNNAAYDTSFRSYLGTNIADGLYIDFDVNGSAVSVDAFLNSTSGQTLTQFESANETVKDGIIWDGEGVPGQTQGLAVKTVSAINLTGVEVTFPALTVAKTGVTVSVKNSKGAVVAVVAQDLAIGATSAQFDFVTPVLTADLAGVWTVGGVNYSFTELKLVQDIVTASTGIVNEVKLLGLLNEAGIKNINTDYIGVANGYAAEIVLKAPVKFVDVQKNIDDVNKVKADNATEAATVKTVVDSTNQIQLLAALQSKFARVNADWIANYSAKTIGGTALLALDGVVNPAHYNTTVVQIQAAIDAENATQIGLLDAAADTSTKQAAVTTAIQTWVIADDATTPLVTPKADAIKDSNIKKAAFVVAEATTENSLYNALVAYANITPDATLKASELNANLKTFYLAELNTGTNRVDLVADIILATDNIKTSIVTAADAIAVEAAVVDLGAAATTLSGTDNATNKAAFTAQLQKLASYTSHKTVAAEKFLMTTIDNALLVDYATAIDNDLIGAGSDVADVQASVTVVNDAQGLLASVAVIANSASTVAQVRDALVDLALANPNVKTDAFVELSSQIKLEVAQFVVTNRANLEVPLTAATITANGAGAYNTAAIGRAMADQVAKVAEFNAIGDLSTNPTAATTKLHLDTYAYAPYVALTNAQKIAVAGSINSLTKPVGDPVVITPLDFTGDDAVTTLKAANAIIDAAIAAQ